MVMMIFSGMPRLSAGRWGFNSLHRVDRVDDGHHVPITDQLCEVLEARTEMLIGGQRHPRVVLGEYVAHYNGAWPHRSLDLHPPRPQPTILDPDHERIRRRPILCRLINEYDRAA